MEDSILRGLPRWPAERLASPISSQGALPQGRGRGAPPPQHCLLSVALLNSFLWPCWPPAPLNKVGYGSRGPGGPPALFAQADGPCFYQHRGPHTRTANGAWSFARRPTVPTPPPKQLSVSLGVSGGLCFTSVQRNPPASPPPNLHGGPQGVKSWPAETVPPVFRRLVSARMSERTALESHTNTHTCLGR